jgi:hypothetical protein
MGSLRNRLAFCVCFMRPSCSLCVLVTPNYFVLYVIRVAWKESRRLVLPRTYCCIIVPSIPTSCNRFLISRLPTGAATRDSFMLLPLIVLWWREQRVELVPAHSLRSVAPSPSGPNVLASSPVWNILRLHSTPKSEAWDLSLLSRLPKLIDSLTLTSCISMGCVLGHKRARWALSAYRTYYVNIENFWYEYINYSRSILCIEDV